MQRQNRWLSRDEAAEATLLEIAIVRYYAECGLIAPSEQGYDEAALAELRRVRRLMHDLELDHPAIEIVLQMRQRMTDLQAQVRSLQLELRRVQRSTASARWVDGEWYDAGE